MKERKLGRIFSNKFLITGLLTLILFSGMICSPKPAFADYSFQNSPLQVNSADNSINPRIVASGNNIYVAWYDADLSDVFFSESTDGGSTFSIAPQDISSDSSVVSGPQLAISGSNVYMVWVDNNNPSFTNQVFFSRSTDGGMTFSSPATLISPPSDVAANPEISVSGNNVYIIWQDSAGAAKPEIFFTSSSNGGATFGSTSNLSNNAGDSTNPQILASGSGVFAAWQDDTTGNNEILYEKSTDYGSTFNLGTVGAPGAPLDLSSNSGSSTIPQIAVSGNYVYVTWNDETPGYDAVFFSRSIDDGDTFSTPVNLSTPSTSHGSTLVYPQISESGNNVYVAWFNATATVGKPDVWFQRSTDNGATFNGGTSVNPGPATNISNNSGDSVDPQIISTTNNVFIIWADDSAGIPGQYNIYSRVSTDGGATFGSLTFLNPNADPGAIGFPPPQVAASGNNEFVSWSDNNCGDGSPSCSGNPYTAYLRVATPTTVNIAFDQSQYKIGSTATVSITNPSSSSASITPVIKSTSDSIGFSPSFVETGAGTHTYTGTVTFTSGATSGNSLHVSAGDVITVTDGGQSSTVTIYPGIIFFNKSAYFTDSVIILTVFDENANTDPTTMQTVHATLSSSISSVGVDLQETGVDTGIFSGKASGTFTAKVGDTITASYLGSVATSVVVSGPNPGGGGGGLIRPGLVLDAIVGVGGSPTSESHEYPTFLFNGLTTTGSTLSSDSISKLTQTDPTIPIMPSTNHTIDFPLSIDGNGFALSGHANTISTNTEEIGKPANLKIVLHDNTEIVHLSMLTNLRAPHRDIQDSDTSIIYDQGKPLMIIDPNGFFADVKVNENTNGDRYEFDFNVTFAKPMSKSDIILRAWNNYLMSQDMDILDAWEVVPATTMTTTNGNTTIKQGNATTTGSAVDLNSAIKEWGGYLPTSISDSQLLQEFGMHGTHIPSWFMKTTKWLENGNISQDDFVTAIKYMYQKGVIK